MSAPATAPAPPALGAAGGQPTLGDALAYIDQVKSQFRHRPEVYNRFLDVMKDFKRDVLSVPGVMERVSELFEGHDGLILAFNTFLPPGHRIGHSPGEEQLPAATTPLKAKL